MEEKLKRSQRSRETDSDRQNRGLTLSFVSVTLNSRHIIQRRPGTDGRQQAPVTGLQGRDSFSASLTEQRWRRQAGDLAHHLPLKHYRHTTDMIIQHCVYSSQSNKDISFEF